MAYASSQIDERNDSLRKLCSYFDPSRKVTIASIHSHELVFNNGPVSRNCDVCNTPYIRESYRCTYEWCDFDCCLKCYQKQEEKQQKQKSNGIVFGYFLKDYYNPIVNWAVDTNQAECQKLIDGLNNILKENDIKSRVVKKVILDDPFVMYEDKGCIISDKALVDIFYFLCQQCCIPMKVDTASVINSALRTHKSPYRVIPYRGECKANGTVTYEFTFEKL